MFGIGCRLSSLEAIDRILKLKQRTDREGLIILVPHIDWFTDKNIYIPDRLHPLLDQYWPGNLTAVFNCDQPEYEHVSVNGKVAFRVPNDELLRYFIELLDEPMISTSVNLTSLPPVSNFDHLTGIYASWFDYGIVPSARVFNRDVQPSTIVEYVHSYESHNQSGFDELRCLREGSIPFYEVKKSFELPTIMFVCTANICRSPMADKLFNHYAVAEKLRFAGDSCGLLPGGHQISAGSLQILLEQGILEARDHISKQVTPEMVNGSRLVLTMEEKQRDFLRKNQPEAAKKIMTLNEAVGDPGDIADPYGSDIDNYRKTFEAVNGRILRLIALLKNNEIKFNQ